MSHYKKIRKIKIKAEVWDNLHYQFFDENNNPLSENHIGFVPSFLPTSDGNDLILEIDVETGQILNWVMPSLINVVDTQPVVTYKIKK